MRPVTVPADTLATSDPVLRALLARARGEPGTGSVALGIEGGGLAVSMCAGMALALERLGLTAGLDAIYGASSGSLVAAYAAAGRMEEGVEVLVATCSREFVSFGRIGRRAVVDVEHLLDLVRDRPPLPREGRRPDLRMLAVGVHDGRLRTLRGFSSVEETVAGVRAAMAIPFWSGPAVRYGDELLSDGGLVESIPVATPLAEGHEHVLALRSRDAGYRKGRRGRVYGLAEDLVSRTLPGRVPQLIRERPARYDAQAEELARAAGGAGTLAGRVTQLAPPAGTPLVGRLDVDRRRVRAAIAAGERVVREALGA